MKKLELALMDKMLQMEMEKKVNHQGSYPLRKITPKWTQGALFIGEEGPKGILGCLHWFLVARYEIAQNI
jgi:hypothetical protein